MVSQTAYPMKKYSEDHGNNLKKNKANTIYANSKIAVVIAKF